MTAPHARSRGAGRGQPASLIAHRPRRTGLVARGPSPVRPGSATLTSPRRQRRHRRRWSTTSTTRTASDPRLSGWTGLTVRATQDLSSFNLDFLLPVRRVRVDGGAPATTRPDRTSCGSSRRRRSPRARRSGCGSRTPAIPATVGWRGERNWLADRHEVVTMNEPHMAPWWFPGQRPPAGQGADGHLGHRARRARQVIANGRRVERTVAATAGRPCTGARTSRWRRTSRSSPPGPSRSTEGVQPTGCRGTSRSSKRMSPRRSAGSR